MSFVKILHMYVKVVVKCTPRNRVMWTS